MKNNYDESIFIKATWKEIALNFCRKVRFRKLNQIACVAQYLQGEETSPRRIMEKKYFGENAHCLTAKRLLKDFCVY